MFVSISSIPRVVVIHYYSIAVPELVANCHCVCLTVLEVTGCYLLESCFRTSSKPRQKCASYVRVCLQADTAARLGLLSRLLCQGTARVPCLPSNPDPLSPCPTTRATLLPTSLRRHLSRRIYLNLSRFVGDILLVVKLTTW